MTDQRDVLVDWMSGALFYRYGSVKRGEFTPRAKWVADAEAILDWLAKNDHPLALPSPAPEPPPLGSPHDDCTDSEAEHFNEGYAMGRAAQPAPDLDVDRLYAAMEAVWPSHMEGSGSYPPNPANPDRYWPVKDVSPLYRELAERIAAAYQARESGGEP